MAKKRLDALVILLEIPDFDAEVVRAGNWKR